MKTNIVSKENQDFKITKIGEYSLRVSPGTLHFVNNLPFDRTQPEESWTNEIYDNSDFSSQSIFLNYLRTDTLSAENLKNSGGIYLKITMDISYGHEYDNLGRLRLISENGTYDPQDFDKFGALIVKKINIPISGVEMIIQKDDPADFTHTKSKNTDDSITSDTYGDNWKTITHFLIGEVFHGQDESIPEQDRNDTMTIHQYHAGPLFVELPIVCMGDKDYRNSPTF